MKNRFYFCHPLILSLLLLCFAHFSFVQAATPTSVDLEQSAKLCLQDSVFVPGQLLGLNTNAPWIGDVFNVSSDLSTVTSDSTFVVPPIQLPDPSTGYHDTIDYYAIDYNPVDGLYYMLADNSAGGVNLYSVDIATAATIDLGVISFDNYIAGGVVLGMTFDNAGNLYLMTFDDFFDTPPYSTLRVIPAGMLTNPVPYPTFLGSILAGDINLHSMSYNFDDNTIYYSTGTRLYEFDLSGNVTNGLVTYVAPDGCDGQAIEYVGNGILYGSSCNQIYPIDPATGDTGPVLATYTGNFSDLLFVPLISLPIELTGFEVDCNDGDYTVEWKTATEEDVLEFVIERSTNGTDFTQLDKVPATGNSTTPQTYTYRDETAQSRQYYYRLRIVEADGKETFSHIDIAACLKGVFDIVDVFPNPTKDELTILFETVHSDDINFKLTDVLGRTIMEENITPNIGLNTKVIDLSQLASAVYFVVMDDGKAVRKVLRE